MSGPVCPAPVCYSMADLIASAHHDREERDVIPPHCHGDEQSLFIHFIVLQKLTIKVIASTV